MAPRFSKRFSNPPEVWWPTSTKRGYFEGRLAGGRVKINRINTYQRLIPPVINARRFSARKIAAGTSPGRRDAFGEILRPRRMMERCPLVSLGGSEHFPVRWPKIKWHRCWEKGSDALL